ncbi:MAG: hypothetical protein CSB46_04010 [Micrococcales bacterium]|nr:MAG: hypothetical protein CSB46_04010 [Micrococcales bacterium]
MIVADQPVTENGSGPDARLGSATGPHALSAHADPNALASVPELGDPGDGVARYVSRSLPRVEATVAGQRARVLAHVAVVWPTPLEHAAAQVRDHIRVRVQALAGVHVDAVDVRVEHIVVPDDEDVRTVQ